MILSRNDFISYCNADKVALRRKRTVKTFFNDIDNFQKTLRRMEYNKNCNKNIIIQFITILRFRKLSAKLGFTIPINVFGPGLVIMHRGTIVVTPNARVGANCKINADVQIGPGSSGSAPRIGDSCYIGPGVKIFGDIILGNKIRIGANAVVNRSFPDDNMLLVGVPAKSVPIKI